MFTRRGGGEHGCRRREATTPTSELGVDKDDDERRRNEAEANVESDGAVAKALEARRDMASMENTREDTTNDGSDASPSVTGTDPLGDGTDVIVFDLCTGKEMLASRNDEGARRDDRREQTDELDPSGVVIAARHVPLPGPVQRRDGGVAQARDAQAFQFLKVIGRGRTRWSTRRLIVVE